VAFSAAALVFVYASYLEGKDRADGYLLNAQTAQTASATALSLTEIVASCRRSLGIYLAMAAVPHCGYAQDARAAFLVLEIGPALQYQLDQCEPDSGT
jgi:hypothetical protein